MAIHVRGVDLPSLFIAAAQGLFAIMARPAAEGTITRDVQVDATDSEELLVNWLNELIFLHETETETYTAFSITQFSPTHLSAKVSGGVTVEKHLVVKAATFHDLQIQTSPSGVEATVVFDI